MTPVPPSSSDGSPLPPRHRPTLGDLSKDTTESDLWDLEDDFVLPEDAPVSRQDGPRAGKDLPAPRERKTGPAKDHEETVTPRLKTPEGDKIRINVNKPKTSSRPNPSVQAKEDKDFEDLDHWDDAPADDDLGDLPVVPVSPAEPWPVPAMVAVEENEEDVSAPELEATPAGPVERPSLDDQDVDEFSPAPRADVKPVSLRPRMKLSHIEKIGLGALVALLVAVAGTAYLFSLHRLPHESERVRSKDFPIRGALLTVNSATSYWRAPITDGPTADTFRRGTQLLPVIELSLSGGPAAVRVLFRNEDRTVVGDAVTRAVNATSTLKIAATAGFDDLGMHAAYRTGESKPWTIEVYEAPSENTSGRDFKKVFEMNISTDLR